MVDICQENRQIIKGCLVSSDVTVTADILYIIETYILSGKGFLFCCFLYQVS